MVSVTDGPPPCNVLDHAPCGYIVMAANGRIRTANQTVADWLGISSANLTDTFAISIFSLASRVVFETSLLPLLQLQERVEGVSLDIVSGDGAKIPVMMSALSRGEGHDRVTQLVLLKAEVRRNFERELIKARAEAEAELLIEQRQMKLREQFVAVLGHDLRNPLASISSGIRMLSGDLGAERKAELLRLMQGSVQRMSRLIDNVLEFARHRLGGGIELDIGSGDLEAAIHQAVNELRAVDPQREVRSNIAIGHAVRCDPWRIGQMVSNLVGNALVHGDASQPVIVETVTADGGALRISVRNWGQPIPDPIIDKLFDPFERGGTEGNRRGLGLGLFIASEIAKAHGGTLSVRTGEDTTFTFQMPGETADR